MIISHVWIRILVTFIQVVLQKVVHIFTNLKYSKDAMFNEFT